jgi:hypothetical protein
MPKLIIKYKMHGSEMPWYLDEPVPLKVGDFLVGISKDDTTCYIPSDVERLTKQDLKTVLANTELVAPNAGKDRKLSNAEKSAYIDLIFGGKI